MSEIIPLGSWVDHGVKYLLVSHNTKMGAAAGAVRRARARFDPGRYKA